MSSPSAFGLATSHEPMMRRARPNDSGRQNIKTTMQAHTIQWGASGTALLLCAARPGHPNAQGLLWLRLEGGAVRAFRLPVGACHGATLNALAEQCAQDADGKVLEFAQEWLL